MDIGDVAPKVGSPTTAASPNNREKLVEQLAVCLRKAIVEMKAANNLPDGGKLYFPMDECVQFLFFFKKV